MSRPITNPNPSYGTQTGPIPLSQLDTSFSTVYGGVNDSSNGFVNYAADIGTANNYQVTIAPVASGYSPGMTVAFLPLNTNTGASTLVVGALGSISILDCDGHALSGGEIVAGRVVALVYNGTSFQIPYPVPKSILLNTTGNTTVSCSGASAISIIATMTAGALGLQLSNLVAGLPFTIQILNTTGSTQNVKIIALSAPFTGSSNARYLVQSLAGGVIGINFLTTTIALANGVSLVVTGSVITGGLLMNGMIA
jgi:hypothetical protein